jgi:hypothetical protein
MSYVAMGAPPKKQPMLSDAQRAYAQQTVAISKNPEAYGPPGVTYPEADPESKGMLIIGALVAIGFVAAGVYLLRK